jgi:hypothetical protein
MQVDVGGPSGGSHEHEGTTCYSRGGRARFAGEDAEEQLYAYVRQRAKTRMDEGASPYVCAFTEVTAPSGAQAPVG